MTQKQNWVLVLLIITFSTLFIGCSSSPQSVSNQNSLTDSNQVKPTIEKNTEVKAELKNDESKPKEENSSEPAIGPAIVVQPAIDLKQRAKEGEVLRTVNGVTLALKGVKYEVKGDDYAVITGIDFGIVNEGSESIEPQIAVYLWDDNDDTAYKTEEKVLIDAVGIFGLGTDEYVVKNATVRIAFDDLNLTKHIRIAAIEDFSFNPRTFVSVDYDLKIKR